MRTTSTGRGTEGRRSAGTAGSTLVGVLRTRADEAGDHLAYLYLEDGESEGGRLTFSEVDRRARALAASLQSFLPPGERALLLYPQGLEYLIAFFGCLYAGVIAVPAYPPRFNRSLARLKSIAEDAGAAAVLTTAAILARSGEVFAEAPGLESRRWLATDEAGTMARSRAEDWAPPPIGPETIAFLQYTSGSTAAPKGVMVTHANLMFNERALAERFEHGDGSRIVSWLPLYHDMGLIGNALQSVYAGIPCVLLSPGRFLEQPLRWLRAVSEHRATVSGAPNFAFDLCVERIPPERRAGLDLSCWSLAFNGAEPVRAETLDRFATAFAPHGFRREAFYPAFGLAEATLFVSGGSKSALPMTSALDTAALERGRVVEEKDPPAGRDERTAARATRVLVGCGRTLDGQRIEIVRPEDRTLCARGEVGEIWISGPGVAAGYWGRPEDTSQTFGAHLAGSNGVDMGTGAPERAQTGPFLRTGDLGFLKGSELFVTGRLKDLIIVRGLNHYPQDLERTAEAAHPALRAGCSAAFVVATDGERLIVAAEAGTTRRDGASGALGGPEIAGAIREAIAEEHELLVDTVLLLKPGSIPKTSSGKIRRHACREGYLAGTLDVLASFRSAGSSGPALDEAIDPPRTPTERRIARIVSELLRTRAGAESNFFRLGGDSLAAARFVSRLRDEFGVDVPLEVLFEGPTVAAIARWIERRIEASSPDRAGSEVPYGTPAPASAPGGLSFAQRRLWFFDQLEPGTSCYTIAIAIRMRGMLDREALQRSLAGIVRRHAALRTVFPTSDGRPEAQVRADVEPLLACHDVEELPEVEREARAERIAREEARSPFDLSKGPLLRATLIRRDPQDNELILALHHIVFDGWSAGVFIRELAALYESQSTGAPPALPELPLQFGDYAARQSLELEGQAQSGQLAWWTRQLAGLAPSDLPADRPRPSVQRHRGGRLPIEVSSALTEKIRAFALEQGVTLYMTVAAGFVAWLHRLTGARDVSVGTPVSGRGRSELEGLIGFFVNTLVLRTDVSGDPSFGELVGRVRRATLGALAHQDLPFERLVEDLHPIRSLSRQPLFQAMLVLQNAPIPPLRFAGLALDVREIHTGTSLYDLTLSLGEEGGRLAGHLEYDTDLFDETTVERMASQWMRLLEAALRDPRARVSSLPLVDSEGRLRLLQEWNRTRVEMPDEGLVPDLLAQRIASVPETVAVVADAERVRYAELGRGADDVARALRLRGVGPEDRVALRLDRSVGMVAALLGVMKAGAAWLPLEPGMPPERLRFVLDDARPSCVVMTRALAERWDRTATRGLEVVLLDAEPAGDPGNRTAWQPSPTLRGAHPAYVLYTSGSTGRPKGVVVPHDALLNRLRCGLAAFPLNEDDRVLHHSSSGFDTAILEILLPLLAGARCVLARPEGQRDPAYLAELIASEGVTVLEIVPALLGLLIDEPGFLRCTSLRRVVCGGEVLPPQLQRRFFSKSGAELLNTYGPTEATIDVTSWKCLREISPDIVPIGTPNANTVVHLLDRSFEPVPVGVAGEIVLGGEGLARGYLGRPDLTAERFVPDPFAGSAGMHGSASGGRLYRTGDIGRRRADGAIEFLGRLDLQIKLRGVRIEPGEVESALRSHPRVREAVVVGQEEGPGETRLVAYVVERDGASASIESLRSYLAERLPEAMIPSAFMTLPSLPLTANGKVDRSALPVPQWGLPQHGGAFVAARTEMEKRLAEIWSSVLGLERIGVRDNFFELGGDSILSIQVVARAAARGIRITPKQMFERQTVERLAEVAGRAEAGPRFDATYRLSPAQQGMLFHSLYAPGSGVYVEQLTCVLHGPLRVGDFENAWQRVVDRHPILRTSFAWADSEEPLQRVHGRASLTVRRLDWRGMDEPAQRARLEDFLDADRRSGFDLSVAPMMRMTLLRTGEELHQLVWTHHHLLLDGWSMPLLMAEFASFYEASARGEEPVLPAPRPYGDFIEWLEEQDTRAAEAFWRTALAGFDRPTQLVLERPARERGPSGWDERETRLSEEATRGLGEYVRRHRLTASTVVLGAWGLLLARTSGEKDVVFGVTVSGRPAELAGAESMVGLFINTLPLRVRVDEDADVVSWLQSLQQAQAEARRFEHTPLARIQGWSDAPRGRPLFESIVVFENYPLVAGRFDRCADLAIRDVRLAEKTNYPLTVTALPGERMTVSIAFDTGRFDPEAIERMLAHLRTLVEGIVSSTTGPLARLEMLTSEEHGQVRGEWARLPRPFPQEPSARAEPAGARCLHRLFEEQAHRSPEAVALRCGTDELTYAELDRRSNRLARALRREGVGPESRVGVCLDRTNDLLVAILGVLKAGAAYLPLDPTYPPQRLAFMISDARAAVILTREAQAGLLPQDGPPRLRMDADGARIAAESDAPLDGVATGANLAYIIYTSGSTGLPKGVPITHENVVRLFDSTRDWFGFDERDVWTLFHSHAFDFSVWEMWGALLHGGRLVVVPYWVSRSPADFHALLRSERVTVLNQTPSAFRQLMPVDAQSAGDEPLALRFVIFGGEALDPSSLSPWFARHGDERPRLVNMYGITETTVHVTWRPLDRADAEGVPASAIGGAIPDLGVYLLDDRLRPVPAGVIGEIHVGGAGLARGYLGRPDLTAERFVPDPFSGIAGGRLYRSGDLARRRRDGQLDYVGRKDQQLKVRGFRIEAGEVESVLRSHRSVREAVVVGRQEGPGETRLVAYLVERAGESAPVAALRSYLAERLPEAMIPSAFVTLPSLPLTGNGKIDRAALPAPQRVPAEPDGSFVAARTEVERRLAEIWSSVLGVERISVRDNFFELGGDSILSIQVVARAAAGGIRITPKQMFERQTVERLAEVAGRAEAVGAEQGEVMGDVPLTPIQRWFFEQDQPAPHHWNQAVVLKLRRRVEPERLAQALRAVARHHDALRLRFVREGDRWRQRHAPAEDASGERLVGFERVEVREGAADQAERFEQDGSRLQRELDLEQGPLVRAALFDLGDKEPQRLLVAIHHLVVDAVSWRILLEDLQSAYGQLSRGGAVTLPAKTASYRQWAQRLEAHGREGGAASEIGYWLSETRREVEGASAEAENREETAQTVRLELGEEQTEGLLREVTRAYRTELPEALLTGLGRAWRAWTGQRRLLVDVEGHGREDVAGKALDLTRTVGWFTSLYPVVVDAGEGGVGESLKRVKEQVRSVPGHGVGYGVLRYLSGEEEIGPRLERLPRAGVSFNYLGQVDGALGAPDGAASGGSGGSDRDAMFDWAPEPAGPVRDLRAARSHLIDVNAQISQRRLEVEFTYSVRVHSRQAMLDLASRYRSALQDIVAHCRAPEAGGYTPSDFPDVTLDQEKLDRLVAKVRRTVPPPRHAS